MGWFTPFRSRGESRGSLPPDCRSRARRRGPLIDSFWSGLTPRARDYLAWLQKQKSVRSPKKTDLPERWQGYLEKLEALWREHQTHVAELETQLKSLRDADEAGALAAIAALPAARKKDLSQFAKLSVVRGGKRKALSLSTNAARNREWCGALKAQRLHTILDRPET
jgi:type II secretory pathway component PulM